MKQLASQKTTLCTDFKPRFWAESAYFHCFLNTYLISCPMRLVTSLLIKANALK